MSISVLWAPACGDQTDPSARPLGTARPVRVLLEILDVTLNELSFFFLQGLLAQNKYRTSGRTLGLAVKHTLGKGIYVSQGSAHIVCRRCEHSAVIAGNSPPGSMAGTRSGVARVSASFNS
eukprot:6458983-Amphidinium_carterae.3